MADPRKASVRAANRTTRELKRLFNRLGSREHPRGLVLASYRVAHEALRDVARRYPNGGPAAAMETREVLDALERDMRGTASETLGAAAQLGTAQGEAEAVAWGLRGAQGYVDIAPAVDAVAGVTEDQSRRAVASVLSGGNEWGTILGEGSQAGIVWPAFVIKEADRLLTLWAMIAAAAVIEPAIQYAETAWGKQAVPVVDENTTDCCLRWRDKWCRLMATLG